MTLRGFTPTSRHLAVAAHGARALSAHAVILTGLEGN
jgi:hypothetical protein